MEYQAFSQAVSQPLQSDPEKDIAKITSAFKQTDTAAGPAVSLSDLKQEIAAPAQASSDTPVDPVTNEPNYTAQPAAPETPATPAITEVAAKEKAKRWIQFRDLLQSRGFAYAAGNIDDYEKFQLKEWEINWLVDAYAAYMQELGYIPKWLDLVLAELTILSPRCFDAWKMRKLKKENDALKHKILQMEAYNRVLQEQQQRANQPPSRTIPLTPGRPPQQPVEQPQVVNGEITIVDTITDPNQVQSYPAPTQLQKQPAPQTPVLKQSNVREIQKVQGRPAAYKKYWQIDDNFYFINDTAGQYIPEGKRKERVDINSETYPLLIQHNDRNKIDSMLNNS